MRREPSPDEIKAAADRAEGIKPQQSEAAIGRPPKYQDTYAKQAAKLCALGATDDNLADFFEVSVRTISRWKVEHEAFCQALKAGKAEADDIVERSLYQRAVGYEQDAVKIFMPAGAHEPVYAPYRERVAPDVTACIFWLKNRRAGDWRDKHEVEHTHRVEDISDDELTRIASRSGDGAAAPPIDPAQLN